MLPCKNYPHFGNVYIWLSMQIRIDDLQYDKSFMIKIASSQAQNMKTEMEQHKYIWSKYLYG